MPASARMARTMSQALMTAIRQQVTVGPPGAQRHSSRSSLWTVIGSREKRGESARQPANSVNGVPSCSSGTGDMTSTTSALPGGIPSGTVTSTRSRRSAGMVTVVLIVSIARSLSRCEKRGGASAAPSTPIRPLSIRRRASGVKGIGQLPAAGRAPHRGMAGCVCVAARPTGGPRWRR